ncbi:hypothetical protein CVT25_006078 [Psilocybe cyanescens]|uniref:Uncharacterized protein n=1 Tax=Psilocybe cyanescens TaxID=93625 RepID=A0A409XA38_PSICY|nr:hypothetical protein CVT25_006078 [Psilocybe cyanescens]
MRATHLIELPLLHSRFLYTLDMLDVHAWENMELHGELEAMRRNVRVCEEESEQVQREQDELREEVERLVETVQVEHDYKKWPVSRMPLSSLADKGPGIAVHQSTPPYSHRSTSCSHSHPSSHEHITPYAHQLTYLLSTWLSHEKAAYARTHAYVAVLEARIAKWEAELEGCVCMRGMPAGEQETRREREKREEEGDGQRCMEKTGMRVVGMSGVVMVLALVMVRRMGGDGEGQETQRQTEEETEEEQNITMLDTTVAQSRMLERKITGLSERLSNARAESVPVPVSGSGSAPKSASSSSSTTANVKKAKARFRSQAKPTVMIPTDLLCSGSCMPPPLVPPPAVSLLPPLTVPPAPAPSRARTTLAPAPTPPKSLRTLERKISELGGQVDMLA